MRMRSTIQWAAMIVVLSLLALVMVSATDGHPQPEGTLSLAGAPGPVSTPGPTPPGLPSPSLTPTPPPADPSPACEQREVSGLNPFGGDAEGAGAAGPPSEHDTAPTVEEILEGGQHFFIPFAEGHPVDIALRGIASWESVRCEWRGTAAPAQQREEFLLGWLFVEAGQPLPPAVTLEAIFHYVLGSTLYVQAA